MSSQSLSGISKEKEAVQVSEMKGGGDMDFKDLLNFMKKSLEQRFGNTRAAHVQVEVPKEDEDNTDDDDDEVPFEPVVFNKSLHEKETKNAYIENIKLKHRNNRKKMLKEDSLLFEPNLEPIEEESQLDRSEADESIDAETGSVTRIKSQLFDHKVMDSDVTTMVGRTEETEAKKLSDVWSKFRDTSARAKTKKIMSKSSKAELEKETVEEESTAFHLAAPEVDDLCEQIKSLNI